jgi:rhodanese-related sulfurtransferase
MRVDELKELLDRGGKPVVLDVREAMELASDPYPFEVLHIPMGELSRRLSELPRGVRIVCACRSGSRSAHVAQWLKRQGLDAVNLEGGILAWSRRFPP